MFLCLYSSPHFPPFLISLLLLPFSSPSIPPHIKLLCCIVFLSVACCSKFIFPPFSLSFFSFLLCVFSLLFLLLFPSLPSAVCCLLFHGSVFFLLSFSHHFHFPFFYFLLHSHCLFFLFLLSFACVTLFSLSLFLPLFSPSLCALLRVVISFYALFTFFFSILSFYHVFFFLFFFLLLFVYLPFLSSSLLSSFIHQASSLS